MWTISSVSTTLPATRVATARCRRRRDDCAMCPGGRPGGPVGRRGIPGAAAEQRRGRRPRPCGASPHRRLSDADRPRARVRDDHHQHRRGVRHQRSPRTRSSGQPTTRCMSRSGLAETACRKRSRQSRSADASARLRTKSSYRSGVESTELGRGGPRVSRIGLGLAAIGRPAYITTHRAADFGSDRSEHAFRARTWESLDAAYAAGVRYVDVARSYGLAEAFLSEWLAQHADATDLVIGSKWGYTYVGAWDPAAPVQEVKDLSVATFERQYGETRALLGDRLRLYQVHSLTIESGALDDGRAPRCARAAARCGPALGITTTGAQAGRSPSAGHSRFTSTACRCSRRCRRRGTCSSRRPVRRWPKPQTLDGR